MKPIIIFIIFFVSISVSAEKMYQKIYHDNGTIKAEGWIKNDLKNGYWKFYYTNGKLEKEGRFLNNKEVKYWYFYRENGTKKKEGHFIKGIKSKWWLFYDSMEIINHKCQLKNNKKNGYCLMYKNKKLVSARKYKAGKQIKEWTDFKSFKKENNLKDLQ